MDQNEFNLSVAASLGRIESKIDTLAGPDGRVSALETDQTRNWWFTVVFAPLLAAITTTLRHFGIHV